MQKATYYFQGQAPQASTWRTFMGKYDADWHLRDEVDERPEHRSWTLIGCERSQQIHQWFYGERAVQVDFCPRKAGPATGPVLTKCCLFEGEVVTEPDQVVVPWGASLAQISEALTVIASAWEPSWAPA